MNYSAHAIIYKLYRRKLNGSKRKNTRSLLEIHCDDRHVYGCNVLFDVFEFVPNHRSFLV